MSTTGGAFAGISPTFPLKGKKAKCHPSLRVKRLQTTSTTQRYRPVMAGLLPQCKFILLCRNPVDRTYSHFQHSREQGFESLTSFEEALEAEAPRIQAEGARLMDPRARLFSALHHAYLGRSIYADHLERWFAHFPRDQFFVAPSEELFGNPKDVLDRLGRFLGLDDMDAKAFRARNVGLYSALDEGVRARLADFFTPHNERLFNLVGRRWDW